MADTNTRTIKGVVQEYSIPRTDIFIESSVPENSAGSEASGGDLSYTGADRSDAALKGNILVSADISENDADTALKAFMDAGGLEVTMG